MGASYSLQEPAARGRAPLIVPSERSSFLLMRYTPLFYVLFLTACAELGLQGVTDKPTDDPVENEIPEELAAPPPPANARTVDQFDTTTEEQRVAAATPSAGGTLLGTTIASLGDPSRAGFWIETPLADAQGQGRLVYPVNGKSVEVALIPTEGGSSRVSLAALRLLEAPLTDLPVLEVYAR